MIFLSYYQCLDKMIYGLVEAVSNLVAVGKTTHARHHTKHVVVGSVHADLGGLGTLNSSVGKHKLKGSVVDTREVARARWLVLLRAKCEGVHVNASVRVAGVVLVRLHKVEVGTLTLREAVLAVKLKLSSHDRVLTPAVHVESGLSERTNAYQRRMTVDMDSSSISGLSDLRLGVLIQLVAPVTRLPESQTSLLVAETSAAPASWKSPVADESSGKLVHRWRSLQRRREMVHWEGRQWRRSS